MKKKKAALIIISAILCSLLAACGKADEGKTKEAGKADSSTGTEYGYQVTFQDLKGMEGQFQHAELVNDAVYFTTSEDPYGQVSGKGLYQMKDKEVTELKLEEFSGEQKIAAMSKDRTGNLLLAIVSEEEPVTYEIRTVTTEGKTVSSIDVTGCFSNDPAAGISDMTADSEGNIYLVNRAGLKVVDSAGGLSFEVPDISVMDIACTAEGKAVIIYRGETGTQIKNIDVLNKQMGENLTTSKVFLGGNLVKDMQGDLLYYSGGIVYETGKEKDSREMFSMIENSINPGYVTDVIQKTDGNFLVLTSEMEYINNEPVLGVSQAVELKLVEASMLPQKTELVFGSYIFDMDIIKRIVDFNKTNEKYKIVIKEYRRDDFDFQAARNDFNMDIITNKGPDIIDLTSIGNADLYMEKGLLEDLTPWMEQDEAIANETYLEHILDVYRKDEKLYAIIPNFNIKTIVGKEALVGADSAWKLEDMIALAEHAGEGQRLFAPDITKSSLLVNICLPADIDSFVNWETGECNFNSEEFIRLMEFANTYGSTQEEAGQYDWSQMYENLSSGKQMLSVAYIANVLNIKYYEGLFGGEAVSFVGYPVNTGCGAKIAPTRSFGIMASVEKEKKEGAWQFIRQFLLEDYQESIGFTMGFPVMEKALRKQYQEAMTPDYYEDENGNQVEASKFTEYIAEAPYEIYSLSQEDVDRIDQLIWQLDSLMKTDDQINTIIEEEAAAYFGGSKSAQEAADIIQNRIQTYVKENR